MSCEPTARSSRPAPIPRSCSRPTASGAWTPIARFNGMFAFALWDAARNRLVLARDRMGVKPLYIRRTGRSIVFASEIGALLVGRPADPADTWRPEPHRGAVHDFLARGKVDHSMTTFVDEVTALQPGHCLVVEGGVERTIRYWGPPQLADDARATVSGADLARDEALVDEFRALFNSSVRLRLRSDVPLGTCLSGGLDSSSIVATVAELVAADGRAPHQQAPRFAFHARFPDAGIDESRYAELVARRSSVRIFYQTPAGTPFLATLMPVLQAQGEPYGGASINAQHAVMRAAHEQGLKVLLDGQGADELLGGYVLLSGIETAGLVYSGQPIAALAELRGQVALGTLPAAGAITAGLRGAMPTWAIEATRRASRGRFGVRCGPELSREPRLDTDAPSSRARISPASCGRPPSEGSRRCCATRTATAWPSPSRPASPSSTSGSSSSRLRLPDRLRIDRGITKSVLRRAMDGRLPPEVLHRRDKLGFMAPQARWLAAGHAEAAAIVRGGQIVQRGWVEATEVERVLEAAASGRRGMEQLWRLVIVEAWLRMIWPEAGGGAGRDTWDAAREAAAAMSAAAPGGATEGQASAPADAGSPVAGASRR